MDVTFKIDQRTETISLDPSQVISVLEPAEIPHGLDQEAIIENALQHPIAAGKLDEIFHAEDTVAIVTSDITRPMPSYTVLPVILKKLAAIGLAKENITIVIALGSHRKQTEEEMRHLVSGPVYDQYKVINSGDNGFVTVGTTSRGTKVEIDRTVVEADRRICLGNVEYHYFAGFSGGAKAIMPGCSTKEAIQQNHRFMVEEDACAGRLTGNPIREDIEEAAAFVGVDFIVNVVLNPQKEIIYAAAGDVTQAHRDACAHLAKYYLSPIKEKAEVVIVSQAGAPKDLNLYQTQKALDNAKHAVKDGGIVILIGSCKEGFGNPVFEKWMCTYKDPQQMIDALYHEFVLGGHKAAAIAMVEKKAKIFLVSDLPDEIIHKTFLHPFHHLQNAYDEAVREIGHVPTIIAMPYGGSTLPYVSEEKRKRCVM
jgi:nickel-dependent lactate racemase